MSNRVSEVVNGIILKIIYDFYNFITFNSFDEVIKNTISPDLQQVIEKTTTPSSETPIPRNFTNIYPKPTKPTILEETSTTIHYQSMEEDFPDGYLEVSGIDSNLNLTTENPPVTTTKSPFKDEDEEEEEDFDDDLKKDEALIFNITYPDEEMFSMRSIPFKHPYLVRIYLYNPTLRVYETCSGTILTKKTILTTARCLEG